MKKAPSSIRRALHLAMSAVTRHPREYLTPGADFQWSNDNWVHNIFRVYELVFGRRWGVRPEASVSTYWEGNEIYESRHFFTWEAAIAHGEQLLRAYKLPLPKLVWIPVPEFAYALPSGYLPAQNAYRFAIAFGASVNTTDTSGSTTATQTGPTVSGTNTFGTITTRWQDTSATPTNTWGGTSTTLVGSFQQEANTRNCAMWYILNPSSAATVTVTRSGSTASISVTSVYYTGCSQSGQPDSSATPSAASGTSFSPSTTVVAANCWLASMTRCSGGAVSASTGTTERSNNSATTGCLYGDSNGTVSTGSQSMTLTSATGAWNSIIMSIAPAVATSSSNFLAFM